MPRTFYGLCIVGAALWVASCNSSDHDGRSIRESWRADDGRARPVAATPPTTNEVPVAARPLEADPAAPAEVALDRREAKPRRSSVDPPPPAQVESDVLHVNNETISVTDILGPIRAQLDTLARRLPPQDYYDAAAELVQAQIIEAVARHLIWRDAERHVTEAVEPQLASAIDKMEKDRINREFGGLEAEYAKHLVRTGKTRDDVRRMLRRNILIDIYLRERLLPMVPPPRRKELLDYYQKNIDDFSEPARHEMFLVDVPVAAFIDFNTPPASRAEAERIEQEAQARARQAIEDAAAALKASEPFADVAKRYSQGVNKDRGGSWGMITAPLRGRWETAYHALIELEPGSISEIIESHRSYFIVKLGRVEGGTTRSFQEAQPEISDKLRQERFLRLRARFLQRQLDESTIGSLDDFVVKVMAAIPRPGAAQAFGEPR